MKKTAIFLSAFAIVIAINLYGCKTDQVKPTETQQVKPVETQEVKNLKLFFATSAKVDANSINYDESKDEFSINGKAKISRTKLLMFYGFYKNPVKPIMINITPKNK